MLEGFLFGIGLWGSFLAISLVVTIVFFAILFVSYLVKGKKEEESKPNNVISGEDLWGE